MRYVRGLLSSELLVVFCIRKCIVDATVSVVMHLALVQDHGGHVQVAHLKVAPATVVSENISALFVLVCTELVRYVRVSKVCIFESVLRPWVSVNGGMHVCVPNTPPFTQNCPQIVI